MSQLVLTNLMQFVDVVRQNPVLLNIPALSGLRDLVTKLSEQKPNCNCSAKSNAFFGRLQSAKPVVDIAIKNLTTADMAQIKSILNLEKFCYYDRNPDNGRMELKCL